MTEPARLSGALLVAALCLTTAPRAFAQEPAPAPAPAPVTQGAVPAAERPTVTIAYLELERDARYDDTLAYARIQLRPTDRPYPGAEMAIEDGKVQSDAIGINFALERHTVADAAAVVTTIQQALAERSIHFFVLDLPATEVAQVTQAVDGQPLILFNITAQEDSLRGEFCSVNLLHIIPSFRMMSDAMVQFLTTMGWDEILLMEGPLAEDKELADSLEASAERLGAEVIERLPFQLSNDPRVRDQTNTVLMTQIGSNYDVVFVADTHGEFGRYVPYQTAQPRPVVGSTGLVPETWHWSWERQGGPQVNLRFERMTGGRRMTGQDWSAWVAVKAVTQSVLRANSAEFGPVVEFMVSDRLRLDGTKGNPMNFRPWDGQLRQPIFLATHNAVIGRAPYEHFLHEFNELDTLGLDQPDTQCTNR